MPQPQGAELEKIRARREELRQRYLRPAGERPATPVRGVHHLALICRDVEETVRFYQEFLGFPLVELVENRDYNGSSHFFFDVATRTRTSWRPSAASSTSRCPSPPSTSRRSRRSWTAQASTTSVPTAASRTA